MTIINLSFLRTIYCFLDQPLPNSLKRSKHRDESDVTIILCISNDNVEQRRKQIDARRADTPNINDLVNKAAYLKTSLKNCDFQLIKDGDVFDLGGVTLHVYPIPGHTKGSIALYCPEKKALFCGDTMMKNHVLVYAQALDTSAEPQMYIRALSKLMELDVETVWPAHGDTPASKELIDDTRKMLIQWAKTANPEDCKCVVPSTSVFAKPGSFAYKYKYGDMLLNYNIGHLEQIRHYMTEHNGAVE